MKNVVALLFAVLFALAPVVNDLCGIECARPAASECPLHQQTPAPTQCNHDHSALRGNVVKTDWIALNFAAIAVVAPIGAAPQPSSSRLLRPQTTFETPPIEVSRSTVLRI